METIDGAKAIEEVEVGELVWSRDEETGEEDWRPVSRVFITPAQELLELTFESAEGTRERIRVTYEHPLWSLDDGEWDEAGRLELGERVDSLEGPMWLVSAGAAPEPETVYNLEVDGSHTYFVGAARLWVHNTCWDDIAGHIARDHPERLLGRSTNQMAKYLENFASRSIGTLTQRGATIWRRGAEILIRRPGDPNGGTYFKADSRAAAVRYLKRFIVDNGGIKW